MTAFVFFLYMSTIFAVLCALQDEYSRWMTRDPLMQPSFDYLYAKYSRLIPRAISAQERVLLLKIEQKHRNMINRQLVQRYTPRTLDLTLVKICMDIRQSSVI